MLKKTLGSPLASKEIKPVNPKGNQAWIFIGRTETEAEAPIFWPPDAKSQLVRKDPDAGRDWRQEKRTTEDETAGWHHWPNGHEFEQTPGDEGQRSLGCCIPWGRKEWDVTERLNNSKELKKDLHKVCVCVCVCVCACAHSCTQSLSRVWLCNPLDYSLSGSSVHGIFQARILEWVAISSSRGSFRSRDRTHVSRIAGFFYHWAAWKAQSYHVKVKAAQSCPTLCVPMDCSQSGSSGHGVLQPRIPAWVAYLFSRESFWPRNQTWVSCIADGFFTSWATSHLNYHWSPWATIWPSNSIPKCILERNENICPYKDLYTNVYSSIIHNNPKVETTQMSIHGWTDKQNAVLATPWSIIQL